MHRLPKNLEQGEFIRLQFSQGTDEADERIYFARGQWQHEFAFQTELDCKRLVTGAVSPCLVQRTFQLPELHVGKVRRQLPPNRGRIRHAGGELGEHSFMAAQQLKRNRFPAQSQIVEKEFK